MCTFDVPVIATGFVVSASVSTAEAATDAYEKIEAESIDASGVITPKENVWFLDLAWSKEAPAGEAEQFDYTYGDGTTWGNGKTYSLVWGENTFAGWADMLTAMREVDPDELNDLVVVMAPGSMNSTGISGSNNETLMMSPDSEDPTEDELLHVTFLGPQAGRTPVTAKGSKEVANGRSIDTTKEFVFRSTFWMGRNASWTFDGFAGSTSLKFYGLNNTSAASVQEVAALYMKNFYAEVGNSTTSVQLFALGGNNDTNKCLYKFELTDSYFKQNAQDATTQAPVIQANKLLIDNVVFADFDEAKTDTYHQNQHIKLAAPAYASADRAFLGDGKQKMDAQITNCSFIDWSGAHIWRVNYNNLIAYGANANVAIDNNFFGGTEGPKDTADLVYLDKVTAETNCGFSFSDNEVTFPKSTTDAASMRVIAANASPAKSLASFVTKGNIIRADYNTRNTAPFYSYNGLCDISGNLFADLDGNVRMARVSYATNNLTANFTVLTDLYASDEMVGGIKELFTVMKTSQDLLVTNSRMLLTDSTATNADQTFFPNPYIPASVTVLPKDGVVYDTKDLFQYNNKGVELLGFYADEDCTEEIDTLEKGFGTVYALAQYKGKDTTCTVKYTVLEPTKYIVVDPNNVGSYTFNGEDYTSTNATFVATIAEAIGKTAKESLLNTNPMTDVILLMPGEHLTANQNLTQSVAIVGPGFGVNPCVKGSKDPSADRSLDTAKEAVLKFALRPYTGYVAGTYFTIAGVSFDSENAVYPAGATTTKNFSFLNVADVYAKVTKRYLFFYNNVKNIALMNQYHHNCYVTGGGDDTYFMQSQSLFQEFDGVTFAGAHGKPGDSASPDTQLTVFDPALQNLMPAQAGVAFRNCEVYDTDTGNNFISLYTYATNSANADQYVNGVDLILENNTFTRLNNAAVQNASAYGDTVNYIVRNNTFHHNGFTIGDRALNLYAQNTAAGKLRSADISGNVFINFDKPFSLNALNTIHVDDNVYYRNLLGKKVVIGVNGISGYEKSDVYYVDEAKTLTTSDLAIAETGMDEYTDNGFKNGAQSISVTVSSELTPNSFTAKEGTEIVGVYVDADCKTAFTSVADMPKEEPAEPAEDEEPTESEEDKPVTVYVLVAKGNNAVLNQVDVTIEIQCDHANTKHEIVEATCGVAGSDTETCLDCGRVVSVTPIPATGNHTWDAGEVTKAPTCEEKGETTFTCTVCGTTRTEEIEALGHDWESEARVDKEATCGADGSKSIHCKRCDETKDETVIPATGDHTWDNGKVTTEPTCTAKGVKTFTCEVCKQTKTEEINALDHDWETEPRVDKAPTCVENGSKSTHCTRCDETKDATVIPATGNHTWDNGKVTTEPTCTAEGVRTFTCLDCGAIETEAVDALGHQPGEWTLVKEPTSVSEGLEVRYCTRCGKVAEQRVIAKLPIKTEAVHKFVDVKTGTWYYNAVNFVYNSGLFVGTSETTFSPNMSMDRAMFVTVLGRLNGVSAKKAATKFKNVKMNSYYSGYVKWASNAGIVNGTSYNTFEPNAPVTREQICKMMVNYCKYAGVKLKAVNAPVTFKDASEISGWAKGYVVTCQKAGLVNGSDGKFNPKGSATRAEVAKILMNFAENYLK